MADPSSILGACVVVRGHLQGHTDLEVHGRVEGTIHLDATLSVAPSGVVKAELRVRRAVIAGVVVGTIHAQDGVELRPGARVVGELRTPRLTIAEGALFQGQVERVDTQVPAVRESAPVPRPVSLAPAALVELVRPPEFSAQESVPADLPLTPPAPRPLPSRRNVVVKRR